MSELIEILLYVPNNADQLSQKETDWLNQFHRLLESGIKQVMQRNIRITKSTDIEKVEFDQYNVIFQLFINAQPVFEKCIQNISNNDLDVIQIITESAISDDLFSNLKKFKTYRFFDAGLKNNDIAKVENLNNEIWLKLLDIIYDVQRMSNSHERKVTPKNIYIAETSPDQNNIREGLIREFKHLGYNVFPDQELSSELIDFSDSVRDLLGKSNVSIHIIGNKYEPLIQNIEVSKVELQNDIFNEVLDENPNIKRFVWIPPNIKPKSEKQKQYIESFKRNIELLKRTEIIQTPVELFKSLVLNSIDEKEKIINEPANTQNDKTAYIIHNNNNNNRINEIKTSLTDKGFQILDLDLNKSKLELIKDHKYNLVKSNMIVILYSTENEQWLNSKISDIIKAPGFGKQSPFDYKVVLLDIDKKPEEMLKIKDLKIIESMGKKASEFLDHVLEKS